MELIHQKDIDLPVENTDQMDKFNINRKAKPRIADVQCSRMQFEPGDRLLVRTYVELDAEQKKKLSRSIQKWAGPDIEVLIINATQMEIEVQKKELILGK